MTIHCVTPNPAVDLTYRLGAVALHAVNRIDQVSARPGGKGVNVARLLAAVGAEVAAYGFLGGHTGTQLSDLLHRLQPGIEQRWTTTSVETRRTIAVVDDQDTTMLNEPGRPVDPGDWERLNAEVAAHCRPGDVVTVSGSLPSGSDPAWLARLVVGARRAGACVIVDTSGPGLIAAASAGAQVLKPNQPELFDVTGAANLDAGVAALLDAGCQAVVVSLGEQGLTLGTTGRRCSAKLGRKLTGNPTGAGDAVVAALAYGLSAVPGLDLTTCLAAALSRAVAWSAAAVLSPVAGELDHEAAEQFIPEVTVKEL